MWLHDPAQSTAGINDVVEIVAHRAMKADANGLGDGVSGQILPHLDAAFACPGRTRLLKTGVGEGDDESATGHERSDATLDRRGPAHMTGYVFGKGGYHTLSSTDLIKIDLLAILFRSCQYNA